MPEGVEFPFPSLLFHEGRTYGQPEVVLISLPQVATGLRLRLPGSFRRRAFHADLLMPQGLSLIHIFRPLPIRFCNKAYPGSVFPNPGQRGCPVPVSFPGQTG